MRSPGVSSVGIILAIAASTVVGLFSSLVHLLLRFLAWRSRWAHSFTRLFTFVRAALWLPRDLAELIRRCGTANGDYRALDRPAQAWLPGLAHPLMGQQA